MTLPLVTKTRLEDRIWKVIVQRKEIIVIDYSFCKADEMIELAKLAREEITKTDMQKLLLVCFKNTHLHGSYMRYMEQESPAINHLIKRNALVGIDRFKMFILKAFNLLMGTDYRAFRTEQEALAYLLESDTVDYPHRILPHL